MTRMLMRYYLRRQAVKHLVSSFKAVEIPDLELMNGHWEFGQVLLLAAQTLEWNGEGPLPEFDLEDRSG